MRENERLRVEEFQLDFGFSDLAEGHFCDDIANHTCTKEFPTQASATMGQQSCPVF